MCTLVVSGFLAVSIDEHFEGGESSDCKLLCQLLLLGGVHLGQTYGRTFFPQFSSSLGINGLQLLAVTAPGSICTNQLVVSLPEARVCVCVLEQNGARAADKQLLAPAVAIRSSCRYAHGTKLQQLRLLSLSAHVWEN